MPEKPLTFLFYESNIVNKILKLPFPHHGILMFGHGRFIASIVTIFGLFYYLVILNSNAHLIEEWIDYTYIDAHTGAVRTPLLQAHYSLPKLIRLILISQRDKDVLSKSKDFARNKFDEFLKEINLMK
jgi:hypothetical protein